MVQADVKLNEWLVEGFDLYRHNLGGLLLPSVAAVVIGTVTLGLLAGPMLAGLARIILALYDREEQKPGAGDVFKGFRCFLPSFLFVLTWGLAAGLLSTVLDRIPVIGRLLSLALTVGFSTFLMFGIYLIVDQGAGMWAASRGSIGMVRSNLFSFLGFGVMTTVIGLTGLLACGVGLVFTLPLALCILGVAYREVFTGVSTGHAVTLEELAEKQTDIFESGLKRDEAKTWEISDKELEELDKDDPDKNL